MAEGQLFVVEAEEVQDGGVDVVAGYGLTPLFGPRGFSKGVSASSGPCVVGKNDSGRNPKSSPMQTSRRGAFDASAPCSARLKTRERSALCR
jgi:hypothetical protein